MDKKNINIYQKVSGSQSQRFGDDTLRYSKSTSAIADYVSGMFMDSMHQLSELYATIIWKYFENADRYVFINVQGGYTKIVSQGRSYAYRSSFEVSRADLNKLSRDEGKHICYKALFDKMPEMMEYNCQERVETQTDVDVSIAAEAMYAAEAQTFADRILDAIVRQKRLFVALEIVGRNDLHQNALRQSKEFQVITAALELLPAGFARYANFALCVDDEHSHFIDDVLVVVYVEGGLSSIPPEAINIKWDEAVKPLRKPLLMHGAAKTCNIAKTLPGANNSEKPLRFEEMAARVAQISSHYDKIQKKSPFKGELSEDEWPVWLLEHKLLEVKCADWQQLSSCTKFAPKDVRKELLKRHRQAAEGWTLTPVMSSFLDEMQFDAKTLTKWRESIFDAYLYDSQQQRMFAFLFPEGAFDFKAYLDFKFVKNIKLCHTADKEKENKPLTYAGAKVCLERWIKIFDQYDALDEEVRKAFAMRFSDLPFEKLDQIVDTMRYLNCFCKGFDEKNLKSVANSFKYEEISQIPICSNIDFRKLTEGQKVWVRDTVKRAEKQCKAAKYKTIDDFLKLAEEKHPSNTEIQVFGHFESKEICEMLENVFKRTPKEYGVCCEKLLRAGKNVKNVYEKKDPAENVCYDGVLTSLIGRCSESAKKNLPATLVVADYSKWDEADALFRLPENHDKCPMAWYVLFQVFAINVAEIEDFKKLNGLFIQICSKCTEEYSETNAKHMPYAKEVINRIKDITKPSDDNQEEVKNMEKKYKKIFKNLEKDEVEHKISDMENGNDTEQPPIATLMTNLHRLYKDFRWWIIGIGSLVVLCIIVLVCIFFKPGGDSNDKQQQQNVENVEQQSPTLPNDSFNKDSATTGAPANPDSTQSAGRN